MTASYTKYILDFKRPGGTSRGTLHQKETYFLKIRSGGKSGIGECALFRGLSYDDRPDFEEKINWLCVHINQEETYLRQELQHFPSLLFGWEQAMRSVVSEDPFELFTSAFTQSMDAIPINGLIWMGDRDFMQKQIEEKLRLGFDTLKLKIGALDFETELDILASLRKRYSASEITLRVDANGAFGTSEALDKLEKLSAYELHSIEQPIMAGQWEEMADLCRKTPVPIALDEELIGIVEKKEKESLLKAIRPQFIILKPSLIGGFSACDEWIGLTEAYQCGWWITSALESNVGLNAIAQYTYTLASSMAQGLGTGGLFQNNLDSPLVVANGKLMYDKSKQWSDVEELFKA